MNDDLMIICRDQIDVVIVENNQVGDENEKNSYQTFIFGNTIFLVNSIPNIIIIIIIYQLIKKINEKIEKLIIKFENNNIINVS